MVGLDKSSCLFFLLLSAYFSIKAYSLGLGTLSEPDAGLFPFILALSLGLFSILSGLQAKVPMSAALAKTAGVLWNWKWRNPLFVTVVLVAYATFLETIGFVLCTFLALFLLSLVAKPRRVVYVFLFAALSTAGAYLVFQVLIKASLPRGIL